jgi:hypothetical protein
MRKRRTPMKSEIAMMERVCKLLTHERRGAALASVGEIAHAEVLTVVCSIRHKSQWFSG